MTAQPAPAARVADFDEFYAATAKRMVAVVYAVTGDLGEAEDAVQEAYARAWQRWGALTAEGDPAPWVRTVALRLAVSTWRKARNRMRAHFRHGPPPDAPGLAPDRVALVAALRALGDDQRTAVVMHHLLDLPVEEIARETGVSSAAVRTRLSRGRKALGAHLRDDPDDPDDPTAPGLLAAGSRPEHPGVREPPGDAGSPVGALPAPSGDPEPPGAPAPDGPRDLGGRAPRTPAARGTRDTEDATGGTPTYTARDGRRRTEEVPLHG